MKSESSPDPTEPIEGEIAESASEATEVETEGLLELVLAEHAARTAPREPPSRIDGVVIGRIVAIGPAGEPLVDYAESPAEAPIAARAMTLIGPNDVGREAALLFEGGARDKPVVMGLMHVSTEAVASESPAPSPAPEGEVDGERLVFTADKEIVLRCGKASLTLTKAGKILIRGAYVLTRSSGVNRIQGGSVQIN